MSMEVHKKKIWLEILYKFKAQSVLYYLPSREGHPAKLPSPSSPTHKPTTETTLSSLVSPFSFRILPSWPLEGPTNLNSAFGLFLQKSFSHSEHSAAILFSWLLRIRWQRLTDVSQCLTQDRHPILCRYKHVSPCLLRMPMSHTVNYRVSAGPLVNDIIFNKSTHTYIHKWGTRYPILFIHFNFKNEENKSSPSKSPDCVS